MPNVHKIFGPPGTGKTTYLLNVVQESLTKGIPSERIGYFSFTKKAANEAKDRAIEKFPHLNARTSFPYFRTLHSLAFQCLGTKSEDIMQSEHYREFAKQAGIELELNRDEEMNFIKPDNPILNEVNLARIKGMDLRQHYNQCGLDIEWHHFEFVERTYRHYKQDNSLMDFTDLLELVITESHRLPSLDVLIVDEAQDLSRLQWNLVEALSLQSKATYLAGDDDQAVFTWAGADVKSFLSFEGTITVLNKSYRIPSTVHTLANLIVEKIQQRQPKTWEPREFEGSVMSYHRFEDVPIDQGQWLIMASTNYMLNPVHDWIKSLGLLFERNHVPSLTPQIATAVVNWERLRKGRAVPFDAVENVYRYMGSEGIARGYKTFKTGDPGNVYTLAELQSQHGLLTDAVWHESLSKIAEDKREYLIAMLRRGTRLMEPPRIKLSTIHGAKGGEADNVMLMMDLSPKFAKQFQENGDNIQRLFYVGVTRAKQSLHLILPKHIEKGFRL